MSSIPNNTIKLIFDKFSQATNISFRLSKKEKNLSAKKSGTLVKLKYGDARFTFTVEYKTQLDITTIDAIIYYLKQLPEESILCTKYINQKLASKLRERKISYLDLAGNAYINKPPILVDIQGKRTKESPLKETSIMFAPAGLRVIFIFLCNEKYINYTYRAISALAGVSLGMLSRVMQNLKQHGFFTKKNNKNKILLDKPRLLEQWVIFYQSRLRPKLIHRRYTTKDTEWKNNIKLGENSFWSGEVAAEKLTNYLRPDTGTIYTHENPNTFALSNNLKEHDEGKIEILRAFWSRDLITERSETVPAVLVYADLLAQRDPRCQEVAKIIFEKEISEYLK